MGKSDTLAESFDAQTLVGASWFSKLVNKVKSAAGTAAAFIQTSEGKATLEAFAKAGDMVTAARGGDKEQQNKIEGVADLAARGDPSAKQATALFKTANDLIKKAESEGKAAAEIYSPLPDGPGAAKVGALEPTEDFDVEQYDWGW